MTFIRDIDTPRFVSENLQELRQLQVAKEIRMLGTQGVDNKWHGTHDFWQMISIKLRQTSSNWDFAKFNTFPLKL